MDTIVIDDKLIKALAPERPDNGNKGTFGMAQIVAGSEYMTGAAVLAVSSALRSGAGLVRLFTTDEALMPTRINCPCAIASSFDKTVPATLRKANELSKKVTSVAIGPGIDEKDERYKALLEYFILNAPSLVIDAGAINLIAKDYEYYKALFITRADKNLSPAILTPHIGEFRRLLGRKAQNMSIDELNSECAKVAKEIKSIIVLKNNNTLIFTNDSKCYSNYVSNSGMAKGGSGDVLTGLIAGLLAQNMAPVDAAVSGVYIHSLAGAIAAEDIGKRAMLPVDIIEYLPETYERIGW